VEVDRDIILEHRHAALVPPDRRADRLDPCFWIERRGAKSPKRVRTGIGLALLERDGPEQ
jgi:hypothetical protein